MNRTAIVSYPSDYTGEVTLPDGDVYPVVKGSIRTPGRFEGERQYAPWYYEMSMHGDGEAVCAPCPDCPKSGCTCGWDDEAPIDYTEFDVTPEDVALFPELADRSTIRFAETDTGFWREVE